MTWTDDVNQILYQYQATDQSCHCVDWTYIHSTISAKVLGMGYTEGSVGPFELLLRNHFPQTITVNLVISNLQSIPSTAGPGTATITWSQNIEGMVKVTVDGAVVNSFMQTAGEGTVYLNGLSAGTHTICVEAA